MNNTQYKKRTNLYFLIILLITILAGLKFVPSVYAAPSDNNNELNNGKSKNFYLNIDNININNQKVQFNLNAIETNLSGKEDRSIYLNLQYKSWTDYDPDNDGIETLKGVIDFTVENTRFNEEVNEEKLCTRWEIYSVENEVVTTLCYGNEKCCNFVSLIPTRTSWKEPLYLTYGLYGASYNNIVSSQVIHVDYNTSLDNPYSNIYYSNWDSLSAIFREENSTPIKNMDDILKKIDKIRSKNTKIKKIELKDSDDKEIKDIAQNKNVSLVFNISVNDKVSNINSLSANQDNEEIIVAINNFDGFDADWNKSEDINITTENRELENSLLNNGIKPKKIVSLKGVNKFLNESSYFGTIRIKINEEFNKVIYCPDDTINSCRRVDYCLEDFNGIECYTKELNIVTIYLPHFSSIIIALDNSTLNLSINSPDNSAALTSGENVFLNFSANMTVNANYTLDNSLSANLGNGTSFSNLLNGTLPYKILKNGIHNLSIHIKNAFGNNATANYSFMINDTTAPNISINITNNSALSATYLILPVNVISDKYTNISYKINGNDFQGFIDLGSNKEKILNITPANGQNNLTINATDIHYNSRLYYFSFNFTETGTCSDAKQNGDETGIDCGGSCAVCIAFNVTTDKASYNLTDNVRITVQYRANSVVNFTVRRQGEASYRRTLPTLSYNGVASETIGNTSNAGNYTINATMYYLNITENMTYNFEILAPSNNPLSVTINANSTTINEGDDVLFSASVSGDSSSITYSWDFENDGTADSTSASPTKEYSTNGTYIVNLTISTSLWSQTDTETITVRKMHNLTFLVKDNKTKSIIQDANVEFSGIIKNTSSDGKAVFTTYAGTHDLKIVKSGYKTFSKDIEVDKNEEIQINLTEADDKAPGIELISPEHEQVIASNNVSFKYKAIDKSDATCRLYIADADSNFAEIKDTNANVKSDSETAFTINLQNGAYKWKVDCVDREGNSNSSKINIFTINTDALLNELSVDLDEQDKSTEDIVTQINEIIESLDKLSIKEKEAAEAMQLKKTLEKAIVSIERANRDLHSLKWRRLNDTELEEETQKVLDKVKNVKETTPKGFEVTESTEFVKYPNKEDVEEGLSILLNQTNLKLSKKDLKNLVEKNQKLQSLITVTTNARILDIEYLSGNKNTITLIQKTISTTGNLSDVTYYEIIPKEIARDINETELLFDYEIIERDPVIEIDINKIKDYAYYIKKRVSLEETEKTKSVLLSKDLKVDGKSFITGLAVVDNLTSRIVEASDKRLIIEIILIIVLAAIYLVYSFGGFEKLSTAIKSREIKEINALINSALEEIKSNNYENASSKYREINFKFNKLEKKKKEIVKSSVIEIVNKVNLLYINKLADEAIDNIKSNKKMAVSNYQKMQSLYKIFLKEYKAEVLKKCLMLHKELNS